jgi:hypothetical protein
MKTFSSDPSIGAIKSDYQNICHNLLGGGLNEQGNGL